jgi:glycerophosphoryl diester phosphodiesterase
VERAIELGADCVEIDVHVVEGRLVVIHDDRLERTTNGTGSLADISFVALRALDAGGGQRIPILEEVLEVVDRRIGVNVELKGPGTAPAVAQVLAEHLASGWEIDHFLVSSFVHRRLTHMRALEPRILLGTLVAPGTGDAPAVAAALDAWSIHPPVEMVDATFLHETRSRGLRIFPFTASDPDAIARMRALGVDGVFTDHPDRVGEDAGLVRRWRAAPLDPAGAIG